MSIYNTFFFYSAKINESKGIIDSKISKMCVPLEGVQSDFPLNVPAKANEPIATTAPYSEDCLVNTTIPDTGPSSVTELNAPHNESGMHNGFIILKVKKSRLAC